ncbi:MAG: methyltransferase domain-containing protein [Halieaceae bacterium]|nr:methyltransferase domain-containing protein [Halieaceae bacterium]
MGSSSIQGELWGQVPQDWALLQEPMHRPLWEAMLDEAMVTSGKRILDAGCGGGGACVMAAERELQVIGLDAAKGMILFAQDRVPDGEFRVGDIEDLPYENNAFDAVFAANSIQYAADPVTALGEFGRVCMPGGRIVAGLLGTPDKVEFRAIFSAMLDALPEPPPGAGPFGLSMPGKLESLFEEAGLTVLKSDEVNCPLHYPDSETFWRAMAAGGPMQGAMRVIGKEKLKGAMLEAAKPFSLSDGSITIQQNVFKYVVATAA